MKVLMNLKCNVCTALRQFERLPNGYPPICGTTSRASSQKHGYSSAPAPEGATFAPAPAGASACEALFGGAAVLCLATSAAPLTKANGSSSFGGVLKQSLLPMRAHSKMAQHPTMHMKNKSAMYGTNGIQKQTQIWTAGSHPESWQHFCHFWNGVSADE